MKFVKGNLLNADTQAIVNTVNTVGIMGKGIALQFKERFPQNFRAYAAACKRGEVKTGEMFVFTETDLQGEKIIINFPTKQEWYRKSQYSWIEEGLKDLVRVIEEMDIKSISLPPLGCGNGGLKWEKVKLLLNNYLGSLKNVDVIIFEPNEKIKEILQKESHKKEIKLTPARAMLLYALFKYEKYGEYATVFTANKLAYFLQESGEDLKLKFEPYTYGPYAQAVEKVLYALNGKYLKGLEQMEAKPFEPLALNYARFDEIEEYVHTRLNETQKERLKGLFEAIEGFESTLSLEILASVHFITANNPKIEKKEIISKIKDWNKRKSNLITAEYVDIAYEHLEEYGRKLNFA
ncbi:macro domain-containing protein [Aequorivita viscosa]|nr:macro domain-containing protein [Aequorivita viscosa]